MKRITLFLCALIVGAVSFAQFNFRCPAELKRNNGSCGGLDGGNITFTFATCPDPIPEIIEVRSNGVILAGVEFVVEGVCTPSIGGGWDLKYCFSNNIPPATTLEFVFLINPDEVNPVFVECRYTGGVFPILLSNFVAARKGNTVNLKWQTATEINAKEFVLQRKNGNTFTDVATIAASNSANGSSYSYIDNNISKGITEYRLKLVDLDGSYKNSDIRAIKGLSGSTDFTVYPNPSRGNATIALSETFENAVVQLLDNAGRVIKTEKMQNNGSTAFRNLIPGMYLVKVTNTVTGEAISKKLTVIQ